MANVLERTPVTVVTGFLGSGKTTLLNHLLTDHGLGRVAALVNDFGAINIDAELVSGVADEVVQLANGCICCTINGNLLAAAEQVLALEPAIDRIVVETTGLADPLPVGLTFLQTTLRSKTSLDAVITVVDCAHFALDLFKSDVAMAQIVHGDLVVLNKIDLASNEQVESLERRIAVIKPRARTLRAIRGCVPRTAIVDPLIPDKLSTLVCHAPVEAAHLRNDGFFAHAFRFDSPLSARAFQRWLDQALPPGLFRGKGIVSFESGDAFLFQLCGGRATFEPYDRSISESRLVFIGREIDEIALRQDLQECLAIV